MTDRRDHLIASLRRENALLRKLVANYEVIEETGNKAIANFKRIVKLQEKTNAALGRYAKVCQCQAFIYLLIAVAAAGRH